MGTASPLPSHKAPSEADAVLEGALPSSPSTQLLQLTVEKRVPPIGWALLATALILSNTVGPVSDMQEVQQRVVGTERVHLNFGEDGFDLV